MTSIYEGFEDPNLPPSVLVEEQPNLRTRMGQFLRSQWGIFTLVSVGLVFILGLLIVLWVRGSKPEQYQEEAPDSQFNPDWVLNGATADFQYFSAQMQSLKWNTNPPGIYYQLLSNEAARIQGAIQRQRTDKAHPCYGQTQEFCLDRVERDIEAAWKRAYLSLDYAEMNQQFFKYEAVQEVRMGNVVPLELQGYLFAASTCQYRRIRHEYAVTQDPETQTALMQGVRQIPVESQCLPNTVLDGGKP